jgi:hypothetical protein
MPIDPNIALGVRPIEQPNMLGQMGQAMALRQAQQEYEGSEGVNELARQGIKDPNAYLQYGKQGRATYESILKGQKDLREGQKLEVDLGITKIGAFRDQLMANVNDPAAAAKWLTAVNGDPLVGKVLSSVPLADQIAAIPSDPKGFADWKYRTALKAPDFVKHFVESADAQLSSRTSLATNAATVGVQRDRLNMDREGTWSKVIVGRRVMLQNSRTGEFREVQDPYDDKGGAVTVGPITNLPDTSTGGGVVIGGGGGPTAPNTLATPSVNNLRNPPVVATTPVPKTRPPVTNPLMVEEKPVWNEKANVFMYPPSEDNPKGRVVETPALQEAVQKRAANQALKVAGFDSKTGSNEISQLIEKSTSGLGANALSKIASSVGWGTEGAQAIAKLETRANQLTLDLAPNGSLGAGFSNDDRIFMLSKLGDVANPNKPVSVRLAAWEDVMERAARTAGVPYPKSAKSTGNITTDPTIDALLNKYK